MTIKKNSNLLCDFLVRFQYFFILLIVALFLASDLFINKGRPTTFDGHVHIITMAQFHSSLKDGDFPVQWVNGFANYGYPLGNIAHQIPAYLGAIINFATNNIVLSYKIVFFIAIFSSVTALYVFLKEFSEKRIAVFCAVLFNFAPYRIINIYIRGALPEIMASIFLPISLLGLYKMLAKKKFSGLILFIISFALLAYSHPMMLFVHGLLIISYAIFLIFQNEKKQRFRQLLLLTVGCLIGGFLAANYLLPLQIESRFFTVSRVKHEITRVHYLNFQNLFSLEWHYFKGHPGPRGNFLKVGTPEAILFLLIVVYTAFNWKRTNKLLKFWIIAGLITIILTTILSKMLFDNFYLFSNIQYPWRFLGNFIFILPITLCLFLKKKVFINNYILLFFAILLLVLRLPQVYGKNYLVYDESKYFFTAINMHGENLNTVWMGNAQSYPVQEVQTKIIEGSGIISNLNVKNSKRTMNIQANEDIRVADYTFYFPGWNVLINGQKVNIQYQDPNHRGYITFLVPQGNHSVKIYYTWSIVRLFALVVTVTGISLFISTIIFRKKLCSFFRISL